MNFRPAPPPPAFFAAPPAFFAAPPADFFAAPPAAFFAAPADFFAPIEQNYLSLRVLHVRLDDVELDELVVDDVGIGDQRPVDQRLPDHPARQQRRPRIARGLARAGLAAGCLGYDGYVRSRRRPGAGISPRWCRRPVRGW
mgnify:CR=1 FL=1